MNSINVVKRCALSGVNAVANVARKAADASARPLVLGTAGLAMASGASVLS